MRENDDFEYPPLALWIFSAEELFIISRLSRSAERDKRYFHEWGRKGKRQMLWERLLLLCALIRRYAPPSPDRGKTNPLRRSRASSPEGGAKL